jgi:hypothetical protein
MTAPAAEAELLPDLAARSGRQRNSLRTGKNREICRSQPRKSWRNQRPSAMLPGTKQGIFGSPNRDFFLGAGKIIW